MTNMVAGSEMFTATYESYGVVFELASSHAALLQQMSSVVPYRSTPVESANDARLFRMLFDGDAYSLSSQEQVFRSTDLRLALDQLRRDLMVHVAEHSPEYVFVHAGVVACDDGALVFPGRSHAGKTTLIAELVKTGATYYSDEYAVIDAEGRVHPYARQLQMRRPGRSEQRPVAVETLGGRAGDEAMRVREVFFVQYVPGAEFQPEEMSEGTAVLEMLPHAIPVRRTPARVMSTLRTMMAGATAWRANRGEAAETARLLLERYAGRG